MKPRSFLINPYEEVTDEDAGVQDVLRSLEVVLWAGGGHDEGIGENDPRNCSIRMLWWDQNDDDVCCRVDVGEWLLASMKGKPYECGPQAEIIALEKLRAVVDALIAERLAIVGSNVGDANQKTS